VDTVGDGVPDWWRAQYFGGTGAATNSESCAAYDPDGDGLSNLQEYLADTNPTNAASRLALTGIAVQSSGVLISWIGGTAATQIVEFAQNLAAASESWKPIFTNTPPTATTNLVFDAWTGVNGFYRVKVQR
jgi:hypothetical protein